MKKLEYYQQIADEDIERDKTQNEMFEKIDDMWNGDWELPASLKAHDYMREFKTTAPHDAMWAAGRVMASRQPFINVQPLSPSPEHFTEERIENLLDWQLYNIIRRSKSDPLMEIALSAVKYSQVAFQPIYIPYEFKGKTDPRSKAIKRLGDFSFRVHNPQTVHARFNDYCLESVTLAVLNTAQEIIDMFPDFKNEIISLVKSNNASGDFDAAMQNQKLSLYDFTDYEDRVIWASIGDSLKDGFGVELLKKPHGIPFMNWVFRKDLHPIMKPVVDADLWANANILESLRYYNVVSTISQARSWSKTISGEGVEIDHTDPASQVQLRTGEEFGMLQAAQIDPTINLLIDSVRGDIRQTTVAEALTTIDKLASGTPFATVNAILQASIASLANIQKLVEGSLEDAFVQMLQWIDYSDIPLKGKQRKTTNMDSPMKNAGADLVLKKGDFDPDTIVIKVSMNTSTPTDKDAAINRAILMSSRLPISPRKAMEDNGLEYNESDWQAYITNQYVSAEVKADTDRIVMKPQLEAQQMQMEQQQQMQQEQMAQQAEMAGQEPTDQPLMENTQGEAGLSPASAAPSMTREAFTNETNGEQIA